MSPQSPGPGGWGAVWVVPTIRLGRRLLVPTHKLYGLLGIPTDTAPDIDDPAGDIDRRIAGIRS